MKTQILPTNYDQKVKLSDIGNNSLLGNLARAVISSKGFYTCTLGGKKTLIVK